VSPGSIRAYPGSIPAYPRFNSRIPWYAR
jgi:hypothetical protein